MEDKKCVFFEKGYIMKLDVQGHVWIRKGCLETVSSPMEKPLIESSLVYEVIRIKGKKPVFLQEHIDRLVRSLNLVFGNAWTVDPKNITESVKSLMQDQNITDNNIKIVFWKEEKELEWRIFPIKSYYPKDEVYEKGVDVELLEFERPAPEAKIHHEKMKQTVKEICERKGIFEVLLLNKEKALTEGSRSNLFFVSKNKIYSARKDEILHGITRQALLGVLEKAKIEFVEKPLFLEEVEHFEAAFLTGTSIHVLPIHAMGEKIYNSAKHPLVIKIRDLFEVAIKEAHEEEKMV